MTLLQDFMYCDEGFERLHLVGKNGLYAQASPERDGRMIVPCIYDALYVIARSALPSYDSGRRTPNMLLLRCSLIRVGGLLDVDNKFSFGLVLVYRTRWIVHFIVLQVIARALPVRPA